MDIRCRLSSPSQTVVRSARASHRSRPATRPTNRPSAPTTTNATAAPIAIAITSASIARDIRHEQCCAASSRSYALLPPISSPASLAAADASNKLVTRPHTHYHTHTHTPTPHDFDKMKISNVKKQSPHPSRAADITGQSYLYLTH